MCQAGWSRTTGKSPIVMGDLEGYTNWRPFLFSLNQTPRGFPVASCARLAPLSPPQLRNHMEVTRPKALLSQPDWPSHPFQMPQLGTNVQHWLSETTPEDERNAYVSVVCLACTRLHLIHKGDR
jgi:hypothetical protein